MALQPEDIVWHVTAQAHADLAADRILWGEAGYQQQKASVKSFLCYYFNAVDGCMVPIHGSIAPVGGTRDGGKILKVRWPRPGQGKRGGFRCVFVAYCAERKVVLCRALLRNTDPSPADVKTAAALASRR